MPDALFEMNPQFLTGCYDLPATYDPDVGRIGIFNFSEINKRELQFDGHQQI